jgi:putative FmdB family regulatory protein
MPLYEYECAEHGVFEEHACMDKAAKAARCPVCENDGRRILSAPHVARMARSEVRARERNEKSCHEPRVVKGAEMGQGRSSQKRGGFESSRISRPWVLEHG